MADALPESDADALRRLEERLDRAAATAERLLADATWAAAGAGDAGTPGPHPRSRGSSGWGGSDADSPGGGGGTEGGGGADVPPAGWQQPAPDGGGEPGRPWTGGELDLLLGVLASLRDRIPLELRQRLADAVREFLLAVRALIDWYLERSERHRTEPVQAQDIPIL